MRNVHEFEDGWAVVDGVSGEITFRGCKTMEDAYAYGERPARGLMEITVKFTRTEVDRMRVTHGGDWDGYLRMTLEERFHEEFNRWLRNSGFKEGV